MADHLNVLGVSGSLRRGSFNTGLIRAAVELQPDGLRCTRFDLDDIPLFNSALEDDGPPAPVASFYSALTSADALLLAVPEYNYSITGVLKNAIDWASRGNPSPLDGKPLAILGAGGRHGTVRAQSHMRQIALHNSMRVMIDPELCIARPRKRFDDQGNLTDEQTRTRLREFLVAFEAWITHSQNDPTLRYM